MPGCCSSDGSGSWNTLSTGPDVSDVTHSYGSGSLAELQDGGGAPIAVRVWLAQQAVVAATALEDEAAARLWRARWAAAELPPPTPPQPTFTDPQATAFLTDPLHISLFKAGDRVFIGPRGSTEPRPYVFLQAGSQKDPVRAVLRTPTLERRNRWRALGSARGQRRDHVVSNNSDVWGTDRIRHQHPRPVSGTAVEYTAVETH